MVSSVIIDFKASVITALWHDGSN